MNLLKVILLTFFIMFLSEAHANNVETNHQLTVEQFVASFNAQDSTAMASFVAEEVEWLSINGQQVTVEAKGKDNLIVSMNSYFKSCSTCRSKLESVISTPDRVSAVEIASWQGKNGLKSQRALAVYEFSGDKIKRVYYFPAEK